MSNSSASRRIQVLRWILLVPLSLIAAAAATSLSVRLHITVAGLVGLPPASAALRWALVFLTYGFAGFLLVAIPAVIAPTHTRRVAVVAGAIVLTAGLGLAVTGLATHDRWLTVEALIAGSTASLAALAVWRSGLRGDHPWLSRLERFLD